MIRGEVPNKFLSISVACLTLFFGWKMDGASNLRLLCNSSQAICMYERS